MRNGEFSFSELQQNQRLIQLSQDFDRYSREIDQKNSTLSHNLRVPMFSPAVRPSSQTGLGEFLQDIPIGSSGEFFSEWGQNGHISRMERGLESLKERASFSLKTLRNSRVSNIINFSSIQSQDHGASWGDLFNSGFDYSQLNQNARIDILHNLS